MKIRTLNNVGVEIYDIDILNLEANDYHEIGEIFFSELLVLIRNQPISPKAMAKIVYSIGNITNISQCVWNLAGERLKILDQNINPFSNSTNDNQFPVQRVTAMKINGQDTGIFGSGILDWHCNLNGVSWAPGVALQAVSGVEGTATSWMDTTKAYLDLPQDIKERCLNATAHFEYSPEIWAEGLPKWQFDAMVSVKKSGYKMRLVNQSEKGKLGLYFHYLNKCTIPSDPSLLAILKEHCFQKKYIQTIFWKPGDIHLSHQLLTLHKREHNDPETLERRVLNRYTFDFIKSYPDSQIRYLESQIN